MSNTAKVSPITPLLANSFAMVRSRASAGCVSWTGPLLMVSARSVLLLVAQGLMTTILFALHRPSPWREAGDWWTVYGTIVDIGCIIGMRYFTRREGIRLSDLVGPVRLRWGRDVFVGLGFFALIFPFFLGGGYFAQIVVYGSPDANPYKYLAQLHPLPIWATVYGLSLWWMIWSPTEETTYQAYALPRLSALTGHTWIAVLIVGIFWSMQHCALPFIPDCRFIVFRFIGFLPGVLVMMGVYLRTKRLAPLIVAHWPMDIAGAVMTAIF